MSLILDRRAIHVTEIILCFVILVVYTDTLNFMSVIVFARNPVNTEALNILDLFKLRSKFIDCFCHICITRCAILQGSIDNRSIFITSQRTIPFKFTIRISSYVASVCQRFHIVISPMIFGYIRGRNILNITCSSLFEHIL